MGMNGAYSLDASPSASPFGARPIGQRPGSGFQPGSSTFTPSGNGYQPQQQQPQGSNGGYHAPNGTLHGLLGDLRVN